MLTVIVSNVESANVHNAIPFEYGLLFITISLIISITTIELISHLNMQNEWSKNTFVMCMLTFIFIYLTIIISNILRYFEYIL
ncbi:MAG: hypothetical protein HF967_03970 [Methanosarcinales archaeon]|jgi:membrane protein YdbS with pleckstrin-like domain|nr:hypothetical protein [Methanosarcinales archaeon]